MHTRLKLTHARRLSNLAADLDDLNKAMLTPKELHHLQLCIDTMKRNTIHNLPPELKEVCQLQGALNRRITCHERRKRTEKTPV